MLHRGLVHVEDREAVVVVDPHRRGIAVEQHPVAPLALPQFLLGPLALADVDDEAGPLQGGLLGDGRADHDRHPAPVLPEILLLERRAHAGLQQLGHGALVEVGVVGGRDLRPADLAGQHLRAGVAKQLEERVVRLQNALRIGDEHADHARFGQGPETCLALAKRGQQPLALLLGAAEHCDSVMLAPTQQVSPRGSRTG